MEATDSELLLQVVYYEVRNWYISKENHVAYGKGGGTINYILELKSSGFDQVIFIVWIKFFSLGTHFSFRSLLVASL